jgi:hypothetical protein
MRAGNFNLTKLQKFILDIRTCVDHQVIKQMIRDYLPQAQNINALARFVSLYSLVWHGRLIQSRECVSAVVSEYGELLVFASKELRDDYSIVLSAVKNYGAALEYASPRLRKNRNIVQIAALQAGAAMRFADASLQGDRAFMLNLIERAKELKVSRPHVHMGSAAEWAYDYSLSMLVIPYVRWANQSRNVSGVRLMTKYFSLLSDQRKPGVTVCMLMRMLGRVGGFMDVYYAFNEDVSANIAGYMELRDVGSLLFALWNPILRYVVFYGNSNTVALIQSFLQMDDLWMSDAVQSVVSYVEVMIRLRKTIARLHDFSVVCVPLSLNTHAQQYRNAKEKVLHELTRLVPKDKWIDFSSGACGLGGALLARYSGDTQTKNHEMTQSLNRFSQALKQTPSMVHSHHRRFSSLALGQKITVKQSEIEAYIRMNAAHSV